jgi:hypothetical protein
MIIAFALFRSGVDAQAIVQRVAEQDVGSI